MENKTNYPELVRIFGKYFFKDESGNLSEKFYKAFSYERGFAIVQKKKRGPWQVRDINGNLSEEYYVFRLYPNGFARVQKTKDGPWQFRDINGNLSEEFYDTNIYYNGFARVQKTKDGPWQFRDISGNLSEEFYYISFYNNGFSVVRKEKDGPYQFRDTSGNLSEEFYKADNYHDGFAQVQKEKDGPVQCRDMLGRVTDERTKSGEDFYRFCEGEIGLEELDDEHFLDPIFYNGVLAESKNRYLYYINEKYSKNEAVNKAHEVEEVDKIIAMIKAKHQAAVEAEEAKRQAKEKARLLDEAERKALTDEIAELFDGEELGKN